MEGTHRLLLRIMLARASEDRHGALSLLRVACALGRHRELGLHLLSRRPFAGRLVRNVG